MSQSSIIAGALALAFLAFITAKGELSTYLAFFGVGGSSGGSGGSGESGGSSGGSSGFDFLGGFTGNLDLSTIQSLAGAASVAGA